MPVMRTVTFRDQPLPFLICGRNVSPSAANLTFPVQAVHLGAVVPTTQGTDAALAEGTATSAMERVTMKQRSGIRMPAPIGARTANPGGSAAYLDRYRTQ